jgi:hypothetical protein
MTMPIWPVRAEMTAQSSVRPELPITILECDSVGFLEKGF